VEGTYPSTYQAHNIPVGIGIHDSSSSLVPYLMYSQEEFILVSTGTWCISMNPFNSDPLTDHELKKDCLSFLSIRQKPVKSSRLFLGRIHDLNVHRLSSLFEQEASAYINVEPDERVIRSLSKRKRGRRVFFAEGMSEDYVDHTVDRDLFQNFQEAYHQLLMDLVDLAQESIRLIIPKNDRSKNLYISGGFSKNPLFLKLIASHFPDKHVYTSEVANATSQGAALVLWKGIKKHFDPVIDLGLRSVQGDPALLG
jgi:sugar (pentulose or hexulose) kinase